ncbi:MAG TPA: metallopeptidase family protein [Actinomycetota bacterium]|nr:metallopeptidase family protein [Actinomycetota bacterium]
MSRGRSARFDEQVLVAWDRLAGGHPGLQFIEIAVSDVPEPDHPALAVFDPADAGLPARVTVYRWAMELRAGSPRQLEDLLRDVLAEQAGVFLGVAPQTLDAGYPRV